MASDPDEATAAVGGMDRGGWGGPGKRGSPSSHPLNRGRHRSRLHWQRGLARLHRTPRVQVSWRIFATPTADPDFARLTDAERAAVNEDLFAWVRKRPSSPEQADGTQRRGVWGRSGIGLPNRLFRQRSRALRRDPPDPIGL